MIVKFVCTTIKLIKYEEFASYIYYLDLLYLLFIISKIADTMRIKYSCIPLGTKIKFFINQMMVELAYIYLLRRWDYCYIKVWEIEIIDVEKLEKKQMYKYAF